MQAVSLATTFQNSGCLSSITPTVSSPGQAVSLNGNLGSWYVVIYSAASAGSIASVAPGSSGSEFQTHRHEHKPKMSFKVRTTSDNFSSYRHWLGMFTASPFGSDSVPGSDGIGFRASTNAGDTTWKVVTRRVNGETVIDTGVPVLSGTKYMFALDLNGSTASAKWSVKSGGSTPAQGEVSAVQVPSGSNTNYGLIAGVETLNAVTKSFFISHINTSSHAF